MSPRIFAFSAPSGAGKTTIIERILKIFPGLARSVSATTRKPRGSEKDGIDYFFKSREEFEKMISDGALIEYENVHGNLYGTPSGFLAEKLAEGRSIVLDIDVKGKLKLDRIHKDNVGIFIKPPSEEILKKRLVRRATDRAEDVEIRLKNAVHEMRLAREKGRYEYEVINCDLEKAVNEVADIIRKETDGK
ncbi:MAG: guanylate kinase [Fibrobacterota bacterium]